MRVLGLTDQNGKKRFCDSRCHNSTNPNRKCICGGLLRGKGDYYARVHAWEVRSYCDILQGTISPVWLNPLLVPHRKG